MTLKPGTRCYVGTDEPIDGPPFVLGCEPVSQKVEYCDFTKAICRDCGGPLSVSCFCAEYHERDNLPCKTCGRADAPLHTTGNCGHCGPNAEYYERDKAERDETGIHCDCGKPKFSSAVACDSCLGTASAIHAIHGMPGEPEPEE